MWLVLVKKLVIGKHSAECHSSYLCIYCVVSKTPSFKKRDFSFSIGIFISLLHHVCLSVLVSPSLPPSLLCASADPSCGFFCRGDAKYQPLPTGEAVAKYIPA